MKRKPYAVMAHLIDGDSTTKFATIEEVVKYVRERDVFGEDGRRAWGLQAEFGMFFFEGFDWSDIEAFELAAKIERSKKLDIWRLAEKPWWTNTNAFEWTANYLDMMFDICGNMGRYELKASGYDEFGGEDAHWTLPLGTYRSYEDAIAAIYRWADAKQVGCMGSIFHPIHLPVVFHEYDWTGAELVPF